MALQTFNPGCGRFCRSREQHDELSITAITYPCLPRPVPEIAARGKCNREIAFRRIRILFRMIMSVGDRPHLLDEIRRVSAHRPLMSIRTDLAFGVKIVE